MGRKRWAALAALVLVLFLGAVVVPLPSLVLLRFRPPGTTAFIKARQRRLRDEGKSDVIDRRPVPLSAVSPALVRAVLAAEDGRFYDHHGIDWEAVEEARTHNRAQEGKRRPRLHGASTITQQLAKNLYLSPRRTFLRKGREAAIAVAMELILPKEKILEHYLSAVEFGDNVYGCEAAERRYFKVSARSLTPAQAAWLAAMLPGPSFYRSRPALHQRRADRIATRVAKETGFGSPLEDDPDDTPAGSDTPPGPATLKASEAPETPAAPATTSTPGSRESPETAPPR